MSEKLTKNIFRIIFLFIIFLLSIFFNSNEIFATEGDTIATGTSGDCTYTIAELTDGTYSVTISGDGAMEDYSSATSSPFYTYRSYITEVYVEDGVTTIGTYSFAASTSSTSYRYNYLTLVDCSSCTTLTSIGERAFYYCYYMTDLGLSGCTSLTSIGNYAFYYCTNLTKLDLSGCTSLTTIGSYAFYDCYGLTSIDLSSCTSLTSIGNYAFYYCYYMTDLDLSSCTNLISIGDYAFYECYAITSLNLSGCTSLTSIGKSTFYWCYEMTSLDLSGCTSLTTIGNYAFYDCYGLTSIDLSSCTSLTSIGRSAFYCCENLTSVKFPSSIEAIGDYAFDYTALEEIDLSNCSNLSYIGTYAFYREYGNYSENVNIYLPENTTIEIGYSGLYQNRIDLGWWGTWSGYYYVDDSGVAYYYTTSDDENYAYLLFVPNGISSMEIPSSIIVDEGEYDVIGVGCFSLQYASDLETITFEDSSKITYLEAYSFAYCENLTTVQGYNTSDEIMENVFYNVSTDYEYTLFECTNIDTTYNLIVYFTFDYYEYFTYETEIDDISEITLELYCDGEVIEEVTINKSEMFGTVYTFKDLELGHEYYVDLKHNLDGWGANIRYYYSGDSTLTYEWIDIARIYAYTVDIDWNDEESTGEYPSEVEIAIYKDGEEIATGTTNAENNWLYTFYVNNSTSSYLTNYSYERLNFSVKVIAEDNIIETDVISYYVYYDDAILIEKAMSDCFLDGTEIYYPGATISLTYTEMTPSIESTIEKTGSAEITSLSDTVTYDITYTAEIDDYKGDVSLILIDTLPYAIDESSSDLAGGTYNSEELTITWEEDVDTVNTYSTGEAATISITKTITVLYEDIDLTEESFTNDVEATISLLALTESSSTSSTETVQDDEDTLINVTGDLVIKYVDLITNEEIADSVTTSGKVGESYDISDYGKEIERYTLVEEPEEKTGTYTEEAQEKIYYYIENTSITVTKIWDDNDDYAENRPDSVTIVLYADGEEVERIEIAESGEVQDEEIDDASLSDIDQDETDILTDTNEDDVLTEETDEIIATEATEEDSSEIDETIVDDTTEDVTEDETEEEQTTLDEWTYTFEELLKYNTDGTEIVYTVDEELSEEEAENYSSSIDGYTITNTYIGDSIISQTKEMTTEYEEDYVIEGETITYSIIVINNGENEKDVAIVDTIPEGTTFVEGSIKIDESETYNDEDFSEKTEEDLEAGITIVIEGNSTITLSFEVTVDDDAKGEITNTATVNEVETNEVSILIDDSAIINVYYVDKVDDTILDSYSYIGITGEEVETESQEFDGYTLVESPNEETYTLTKEEIDVYYYYLYNCEVEVNYIDYNTDEILDSYDLEGLEGETYITEEESFTGYTLIETPDNATGEYTKEKITVNYYYTNMYEYTIYYYYDGELDEEATETGTATVGEEIEAEDKSNGYDLDEENTVETSMIISSEEENILNIYYKTPESYTITVKYVDYDTGEEIAESEEITGTEGTEYITEQKEIDGYTFLYVYGETEGTIETEDIEVTYYYIQEVETTTEAKTDNTTTSSDTSSSGTSSTTSSTSTGTTSTSGVSTGDTTPIVVGIVIITILLMNVIMAMYIEIKNAKK